MVRRGKPSNARLAFSAPHMAIPAGIVTFFHDDPLKRLEIADGRIDRIAHIRLGFLGVGVDLVVKTHAIRCRSKTGPGIRGLDPVRRRRAAVHRVVRGLVLVKITGAVGTFFLYQHLQSATHLATWHVRGVVRR